MAKKKRLERVCMFCLEPNCKDPLCEAKQDVIKAYLKAGVEMWQVMAGVHTGQLNLEGEALSWLKKQGKLKIKS